MNILAVDYGDRRVGLAAGDDGVGIAHGLPVAEIDDLYDCVDRIVGIVAERRVDEIVVGLPKNMDDTSGQRVEITMEFVEELRRTVKVPVVTWDERLTTIQAKRMISDTDLTRGERKKHVNTVSAQLILQNYFEARKRNKASKS